MAEAASFEFNGVVRLTRVGVSFVIFTIFIGFAGINTGNNSLYIGLAFMLGVLILSGIASKGGLKHLQVEFETIGEAWAGRPAHGRLRVVNRSPIWNVRDVVITSPELSAPVVLALIGRKATALVDVTFLFQRRGMMQLKSVDLYTRYPFGFFLKKRRVKMSGEIVVYPRLLAEETARERFRPIPGEQHASARLGAGSDVYAFREFVRGDSLRHVYWKKSAALGRWIIKQTEAEAGRAVHVVIDPYKARGVSDDDFELMVSEAATFIDAALRRDFEVVLSLPRIEMHALAGQTAAMFRTLALLEPSYEHVRQTIERNSIVFTARRSDERKSA